jgi:hypothetical protein
MLATCFTLVSWLTYSSTLKMEATCFSETSFDFQRTIRHYIRGDKTLHNHRRENFKSCISFNHWKHPWNFVKVIFLSRSFGCWGWYKVVSLSSSFLTSEREKRQPESDLVNGEGGLISVTSFCERNIRTVNLALRCHAARTSESLVWAVVLSLLNKIGHLWFFAPISSPILMNVTYIVALLFRRSVYIQSR